MKAVLLKGYGGPERLVIEDVAAPSPQAGEVLVRRGHFPRTKLPGIIGHEIAGEVAELGAGVSGFRAGDRVVVTMKDRCN